MRTPKKGLKINCIPPLAVTAFSYESVSRVIFTLENPYGHCLRALYGHCTGTVRALYGHCGNLYENTIFQNCPKKDFYISARGKQRRVLYSIARWCPNALLLDPAGPLGVFLASGFGLALLGSCVPSGWVVSCVALAHRRPDSGKAWAKHVTSVLLAGPISCTVCKTVCTYMREHSTSMVDVHD